jgi:hypothetical protein
MIGGGTVAGAIIGITGGGRRRQGRDHRPGRDRRGAGHEGQEIELPSALVGARPRRRAAASWPQDSRPAGQRRTPRPPRGMNFAFPLLSGDGRAPTACSWTRGPVLREALEHRPLRRISRIAQRHGHVPQQAALFARLTASAKREGSRRRAPPGVEVGAGQSRPRLEAGPPCRRRRQFHGQTSWQMSRRRRPTSARASSGMALRSIVRC